MKRTTNLAEEFEFSKNKRYVHFFDWNNNEQIIPSSSIRLETRFIKLAANPDDEPDVKYFILDVDRKIEISGCLYFEFQSWILDGK